MKKILRELRKMTNNIIFATLTPVKPECPTQKSEIVVEYNNKTTKSVNVTTSMVSGL